MPKMTMNELKLEIAEILDEAKKKKEKVEDIKKKGAHIQAYGLYDEAFDFSVPQGEFNLYRQQGAVNWGPYTSAGAHVDNNYSNPNGGMTQMKESEEHAIRALVREVIQNGLVPKDSAWAPMMETQKQATTDGSAWGQARSLYEAWYDNFKKSKKDDKESKKSKKDSDYGPVKKHGFEKKSKK